MGPTESTERLDGYGCYERWQAVEVKVNNKPFYRVVKAFQVTYHMQGTKAIHHLVICLSCRHWREIRNKTHATAIIGRLFSCGWCSERTK